MTKNNPLVSICILSYNRPETLFRLLSTIDTKKFNEIEIVICEDFSPKRDQIRVVVSEFNDKESYSVAYHENSKNLGYDGTFCELVSHARGRWLIFMGDDDEFVPGSLDKILSFLEENSDLGYVLKSHHLIHDHKNKELFRYFNETKFFMPGVETYIELFRKSVYIAGFMIRRECVLPYITNRFDGTMLIQLYLLAEVVLKHPSAYLDEPFTQQYASYDHNVGDVMFDRKQEKFIPRKPTLDISLNFLNSFSIITKYIDSKYQIKSTDVIKKDMSKYFYPSLAVHRDSGLIFFWNYVRQLNKLGFNVSIYYYLYVAFLTLLGKRICDKGIWYIKKILGRTPRL